MLNLEQHWHNPLARLSVLLDWPSGSGSSWGLNTDTGLENFTCYWLTAAMEGLDLSPAGGWVTSAPRKMTGSRNTGGLQEYNKHSHGLVQDCSISSVLAMEILQSCTWPSIWSQFSAKSSQETPWGQGMGCLLWVQSLIYVLLLSLQHCM